MPQSQTIRRPATEAAVLSGSWKLSNDSGEDVVIISVDNSETGKQLYEQPLKQVKTAEGQQVIKAGQTDVLSPDDLFTDTYGFSSIIVARAADLFPVKIIEMKPDTDSQIYAPATVSEEDLQNMKLAEKFRKLLSAFPASDLAQGYAAALADDDITKVDAFLKSTQEYRKLTLDMVVAIDTYYAVFPFVWAAYTAERTYFLYASDDTTVQHMGAVTMTNECPVPLGIDKAIPGFTSTYGKSDQYQTLYYADGQFVNDAESAAPAICLQGLFVLKSQLTNTETDNIVISVLTGTVNGQSVLGYPQEEVVLLQQEISAQDNTEKKSELSILIHPDDTTGWIRLLSIVLGGAVALALTGYGIKKLVDTFRNSGKKPEPAEKSKTVEEFRTRMQAVYDKTGIRKRLPNDLSESWKEIKNQTRDVILGNNKNTLQDIVSRQSDYFNQLLEFGDNTKLRDIERSIGDLYDDLLFTPKDRIPEIMERFMHDVNINTKGLNDRASSVRSKASTKEREAMDASKDAIEQATARVEESERTRENLENDEYPEDIRVEL